MGIIAFCVKRPIATSMIILALVGFGVVSLINVPVDLLPDISVPSLVVVTYDVGASAQEIEELITRPMEEVLNTVRGIKIVSSRTEENQSLIFLEFDWGIDMDLASMDVREKINLVSLPDGAADPFLWRWDPSATPVLRFDVSGEGGLPRSHRGEGLAKLRDMVEETIKPRLERLPGVGTVVITGGLEREIRVIVDQARLEARHLSILHVIQALARENMDCHGGRLEQRKKELLVRTVGQFKDVSQIANTIIAVYQGSPVYIRDVADVVDTYKEQRNFSRLNRQDSVGVAIKKESGANTVMVVNEVKAELAILKSDLPAGIQMVISRDESEYINESQSLVISSLLYGTFFAALCLFLFLRSIRSTLVVSLSIPVSLLATFIVMNSCGITRNVLSFAGLALAGGMVLDSSIVILENIVRHMGLGKGSVDATISGSSEVMTAVLASSLTTLAVFFPIAFVKGLAGELFGDMSFTVVCALIFSLFVAFTVIPMLASRILKEKKEEATLSFAGSLIAKFTGRAVPILDAIGRRAQQILKFLLERSLGGWQKRLTIIAIIFGISIVSFRYMPGRIFMPTGDVKELAVKLEMPVGASLARTDQAVRRVEDILFGQPEVDTVATSVEAQMGQIHVRLKEKSRDLRSPDEVVKAIRKEASRIAGATVKVNKVDKVKGAGGLGTAIEIKVKGTNRSRMAQITQQIASGLKETTGVFDITTTEMKGSPELSITIDRERASDLGLSVDQVSILINTYLSGHVATRFREGDKEIDIRVQGRKIDRESIREVGNLIIPTPTGRQVSLASIARITRSRGALEIEREDQQEIYSVSADVELEYALGSVVNDIRTDIFQKLDYPLDLIKLKGVARQMNESFGQLGWALLISLVLIYMIMAAQFESLVYPFVIMFAIPLASIGVVVGLRVAGEQVSIAAMVGMIMLAGIVVNNAIILIDFINILRARGVERREAIIQSSLTRMRPIFITTLTTVLAMIPLTLGLGAGAEMYRAIAIVIVFGLSIATLLTLVVIPIIYSLMDDLIDIWGLAQLRGRMLLKGYRK